MTIAFVTIDGTGLKNEPVIEILEYGVNQFARPEWGKWILVEFTDGSQLHVFENEISVEVIL